MNVRPAGTLNPTTRFWRKIIRSVAGHLIREKAACAIIRGLLFYIGQDFFFFAGRSSVLEPITLVVLDSERKMP